MHQLPWKNTLHVTPAYKHLQILEKLRKKKNLQILIYSIKFYKSLSNYQEL